MNKATVLKITNFCMFISALIQVSTGVALFFNLFVSQIKVFEAIAETHKYNGPVFIVLVMTHLSLNWGWVKSQFLSRRAAS